MKKHLSEKILYIITALLIVATLFFLLTFSSQKSSIIFPIVFLIFYWQKKRFQDLFQKIRGPKTATLIYPLIGWFLALFLELTAGLLPFHQNRLANYLVGLGFYLPYFAIWLIFINRFQFSIFEIFYLSGLSKVFFDIFISRKLLKFFSIASGPVSALVVFIAQVILTLVLFGMLTTLPACFLKIQNGQKHEKPFKHYLIGLTPNFLATGVFIVWLIVLKTIFT